MKALPLFILTISVFLVGGVIASGFLADKGADSSNSVEEKVLDSDDTKQIESDYQNHLEQPTSHILKKEEKQNLERESIAAGDEIIKEPTESNEIIISYIFRLLSDEDMKKLEEQKRKIEEMGIENYLIKIFNEV